MLRRFLGDRDVIAGFFFVGAGTATIWYACRYTLGTLTQMGPGYFPAILGALLVAFGVATLAGAVLASPHTSFPTAALRPLFAITASVFAFALLLDRIGLPLAVFISSLLASAGRPRFLRLSNVLLAATLAVLCVLVFIRLLGVPVRLLPPALQGY